MGVKAAKSSRVFPPVFQPTKLQIICVIQAKKHENVLLKYVEIPLE